MKLCFQDTRVSCGGASAALKQSEVGSAVSVVISAHW